MRADPDGVLLGAAAGPLPVSRPLPLQSLSYQGWPVRCGAVPVVTVTVSHRDGWDGAGPGLRVTGGGGAGKH